MNVAANLPEGGNDGSLPEGNETEAKARRLGWVSKEEFKGDPDKHRSADEFLERGETILPILQRDNKKLHDTVGRVEKELRETRETLQSFSEFASKAEERAYKKAKAELEAKLDGAIATADVDEARRIRKDMAELEVDPPKPAKREPKPVGEPDRPAVDAEIQSWIDNNDWFNKSAALRSYMSEEFGELEKRHPGTSKAEILAEAKRRTVDKFPEKFGVNPKREGAASVATPSGDSPRAKKGGKSYDDLPAEAKKACDKYVKQIPGYTKEKYCQAYDWD
jgi:hypothetical protein